jgi:hypothetical protein
MTTTSMRRLRLRCGLLAHFTGVLVHDHWSAYERYDCLHAFCNAHRPVQIAARFARAIRNRLAPHP